MHVCIFVIHSVKWFDEMKNLSLLRRLPAIQPVDRGMKRDALHKFSKMLKRCADFSSIIIRTEWTKRFCVESDFSSISKLTHLRLAVCLFFVLHVCMSVCAMFILCQPNGMWNAYVLRLTVHFVQIFDVQCLFFFNGCHATIEVRTSYMHACLLHTDVRMHSFWNKET